MNYKAVSMFFLEISSRANYFFHWNIKYSLIISERSGYINKSVKSTDRIKSMIMVYNLP